MEHIRVKDLSKTYYQGDITVSALKKVSLTVNKGDFLAVAGPSGSGKTTLLNLIGVLDTPDEGDIILDGNPVSTLSSSEAADFRLMHIGFVFQSYNLIPVLSALENVEYILLLQKVPSKERRHRAIEILSEVGLKDKLHNRPHELSGGQQQRVAVARALVSNPNIILADEPTANLDSETGENLISLMKSMNEEKKVTFIFSTHDAMVMSHASRLVKMKDGKIVQ